ncbi:MAG: discoidin domain-containing protein [Saprospiraceae bacterium]
MAQKWDIIATYNGVEYKIGWVLYAHLSNVLYSAVDTEVNLSSAAYIGKAFSGNIYGGCWGSCHIHMEFGNYLKSSCYDIMPPTVNIDRVGIVGGLANTTTNCPPITSNLAENSVNCIRSSMYNSNFNCDKAHDGNLNTKWTSNGSSQQSSMAIDLGSVKNINKIVVKHAGAGGEPSYLNTQHFKIEYSNSSVWGPWTLAEEVYNTSQANESVIHQNFNARYVHLYVVDPGIDNYARIPELQVFGN